MRVKVRTEYKKVSWRNLFWNRGFSSRKGPYMLYMRL